MFSQPQYLCEVPFQISTHHIIDLFVREAEGYEFSVLEKEVNQVLVIQENVAQISNTLKKLACLSNETQNKKDDGTLCLVKLQLDTNQVKCIRLVQVKGIIGVIPFFYTQAYKVNEKLIDKFSKSLDRLKQKNKGQKLEKSQYYNDASEFTGISQENLADYYNMLQQQQNFDLSQNPYYLESTAFYMFHKIFCAANYGMGKKIAHQIFIVETELQNTQLTLKALKNIVEELGAFITSIVDTLFMSFNFGKQETRQIMPFCRLSTEKYLYLRLYDKIYPLYKGFYQEQDKKFKDFSKLVLSQFSVEQIKQKFEISESLDDKSKFQSAVQEINKLAVMQTPREKLRCFQIMNSILKAMNNAFFEQYRKLCFLISEIQDPYTEIHFLMDGGANLDKKFLQSIRNSLQEVQKDFTQI